MSTKKSLYVNFATTVGTAHFAWLNKPDTGSEYSDGKYKVTVAFQKDDPMVATLKATIKDAAQREFGDKIPAGFHNPLKDGDESGKEQYLGMCYMTMKSVRQPSMVDAKNQPLPENIIIMGGDTIRVAGAAKAYNGAQKGVSFYLDMVKLIAKNNAGGTGPGNAASVFGEDEGFTADDEPAALEAEVPSGSPIDIDDL
jgi:hypothetical protein|tara:strand:+ start:623 stop:1216 length:594 start_codon:yes stop_codon:yes gene_type:complete